MQEDLEQDNGHFSVLVQRKSVYSISEDSPQSEWDRMSEKMAKADIQSSVPRVHCPEVSSKAKGGGKLSIHHCADLETVKTVFRTIFYVNQLSLYGAVAEMCEECESYHDRTERPVVGGQSSSSFVPSVIKTEVPLESDDRVHKEIFYCNNTENELKSYHNKTN